MEATVPALAVVGAVLGAVVSLVMMAMLRKRERLEREALWDEMTDRAIRSNSGRLVPMGEDEERVLERYLKERDRIREKVLKEHQNRLKKTLQLEERANRVGVRIGFIGALLPVGDEWRVEEMMNHRNVLRDEDGGVPRFHYVRLFLSALEIRWEGRIYPERRVD